LERFVGAEDQARDKPADMLKTFSTAKDLAEALHPLGNRLGDTHDRKHGRFSLPVSPPFIFHHSSILPNNLPSRVQKGIHPKVVSERLGHATVAITLDTYSHVLDGLQEEAAAAVDDAFSGLSRAGKID
jgi:hypothetical protein